MSNAARKSIMDRYDEAEQKRFEGKPLSGKDKAVVAIVRARDVIVAAGTAAAVIVCLPVTLAWKSGSYLKEQWRAAHRPHKTPVPTASALRPDKPSP